MATVSDAPAVAHPKEPAPLTVANFLALVTGTSRFMLALAKANAFRNHGLGLAEWAALSVLAKYETIDVKNLARTLGVTVGRAAELKAALKAASLISIAKSPDPQHKTITIVTKRGKLHLEDVNSALTPLIVEAQKNTPNAQNLIRKMIRLQNVIIHAASDAPPASKRQVRAGREATHKRQDLHQRESH